MRKTSFFFLFFLPLVAFSQLYVETLLGFRIGQTRKCVANTFQNPIETGITKADKLPFETFYVKADSSLSIRFEYEYVDSVEVIFAIEIKGRYPDIVFKGMRLGEGTIEVEKALGKAQKKRRFPESRWEWWLYPEQNYEVLIDNKKHLTAVRIYDKSYYLYIPYKPECKPNFAQMVSRVNTGDNFEISTLLSPTFETVKMGDTILWHFDIEKEISKDSSRVFALMRDKEWGFRSLVKAQKGDVIEHIIFDGIKPPSMYYTIPDPKYKIKRIDMKYVMGSFRIDRISYKE